MKILIKDKVTGRYLEDGHYWAFPNCDECGEEPDVIVVLGENNEIDGYDASVSICIECLKRAIALITEQRTGPVAIDRAGGPGLLIPAG